MNLKSIAGILVALALTIYPGFYHGMKSFRWGHNQRVDEIAARLAAFPDEFQGWEKVADQALGPTELDMLRPIEYVMRRYTHGGLIVQLFVLLGPTGPTAVHTPDICFSTQDYRQIGSRRRVQTDSQGQATSHCWESTFQSRNLDETIVKSWYAWSTDGNWQADENPRYTFAKSPYLLKIQIEAIFPGQPSPEQSQEGEKFVKDVQSHIRDHVLN